MRTIFIILLMTITTQVGAGQLITNVSTFVSEAQVELEQQKFTGRIDGVALATQYQLSSDWYLKHELLSGNGNLHGTRKYFDFNQNLLYAFHKFSAVNSLYPTWNLSYKIGFGYYHKTSKFGTNNYEEAQFPVFIDVEMTSTSGVKVSLSGLGQLDNLNKTRSGSLTFAAPVISDVSVFGKYTNHSSKVNALQHCGSDYFVGFSVEF